MTQCVIKYWDFPTYISSLIVDQSEADFPAVTICPQSGFKEDVLLVSCKRLEVINMIDQIDMILRLELQNHGIENKKAYNWYKGKDAFGKWSSNKTGVTEKELFDEVTRTPKELIDQIYARYYISRQHKTRVLIGSPEYL